MILILFFHAIKISLVSQHNLETKWIVSAHLFIVHSVLIKLRTAWHISRFKDKRNDRHWCIDFHLISISFRKKTLAAIKSLWSHFLHLLFMRTLFSPKLLVLSIVKAGRKSQERLVSRVCYRCSYMLITEVATNNLDII